MTRRANHSAEEEHRRILREALRSKGSLSLKGLLLAIPDVGEDRDFERPAVSAWFEGLADEEIFISVLTVGEIRRGIESIRRRDLDSAALDGWLARVVEVHGDRIIQIDRAVAEEWARLNLPDPLPVVDGLLAATAKVADLTLATRNVTDIEDTGVSIFNLLGGSPSSPCPQLSRRVRF